MPVLEYAIMAFPQGHVGMAQEAPTDRDSLFFFFFLKRRMGSIDSSLLYAPV